VKTTLRDLYRGPLNVWVEDALSHAVLTYLWADSQINVIEANGKPGVQHMVQASPVPLRCQVHGIVDRDFDDGDESDWPRPEHRVLRTPTHEMENLLLDFEILATLSKGESAEQIRTRAHARAREILFWMVYKAVLRDMQGHLAGGFPGDAPQDALRSVDAVEQRLSEHAYWGEHGARWARWSEPRERSQTVRARHDLLQAELDGEGWRSTFSGKELFRYLRSHVRGLDETPARPPQPTDTDRDLNLAKRIARKMREPLGNIPPAITRMRETLRTKAGL
jgi:hypothetical protein